MTINKLSELPTPVLLLERDRLRSNLKKMAQHVSSLGCVLRPHAKTHKSTDVLKEVEAASEIRGVTVSTLCEARCFFEAGQNDILYAVGMTPNKISEAAALINDGCNLKVITDSPVMADLLAQAAQAASINLPVLIELDVDGHRSGIDPDGDELLDVARRVDGADALELAGVMTHAGGSYGCRTVDEIKKHARQERDHTVGAAQRIREAGLECPIVSIGSTPTACVTEDLNGVTEIRPGVYTFYDLFQAGLGIVDIDDIAISVLATVIGHQANKGWVIVDGGWMAMSRDRSTESQAVDQGYGVVCTEEGEVLGDIIMGGANQEHGILQAREGEKPINVERLPIGSKVRILPNHACATAAQYDRYYLVEGGKVSAQWPRINGW